jgi:drug/metabolite transporter (DMT)-like permease
MVNVIAIIIVLVGGLVGGIASIFMKRGSAKFNFNPFDQIRNTNLMISLVLYLSGTLSYIYALSMEKISILNPFNALMYIWVTFFSIKFLGEKMNRYKWAGIILIILGIAVFSVFIR